MRQRTSPERDDASTGHVLAAVVADTLDDGARAGVAHGEALTGDAAEEGVAVGRTVEHGVADDHVLLGDVCRVGGRAHDERAAGKTLARVIVRLARKRERDALREPAAEALPGGAEEVDLD